ncbi:MAG: exo-alpha-sialidase [Clostridia bacterium]|nr:exo-alpha-sialidase [Clostridia bacterium]
MKRIVNIEKKVTLIAGGDGRYHAFPDAAILPDNRLLAVWRESDTHVASESSLLMSYGSPDGSSWSEPKILHSGFGHMPRITVSGDGTVYIIDDGAPPPVKYYAESSLFISRDGGITFERKTLGLGDGHTIPYAPAFAPDRILLKDGVPWACCAQIRLGSYGHKDDYTFCNMLYRTDDGGGSWYPGTIAACDRLVHLCEPSICRMPDGGLLGMYRLNPPPYTKTRYNFGDPDGYTWTEPAEAPFDGQRPTAGFLSDGRLLVTYRKITPPYGVCAWIGTLDELKSGGGAEIELLSADGIGLGDMGYTGWVETAPGKIVCVTHHRYPDEPMSMIRSVGFEI